MPPFRLLVDVQIRNATQATQNAAPNPNHDGGKSGAGRRVHEWHELVREPRHGTANANSADVWAASDSIHPTPFGHVAIHYRAPAADFHEAFRRTIFAREIGLFVITGTVAPFVHGLAEEPRRPQLVVQRNHGSQTGNLIKKIEHCLHHIVRLDRAAWNIYDWEACL